MVSLNVFANHNIRGFTILPFTARRLSHCHHRCENPVSITPLFATHTSCSQLAENITALSSLLATHTDFTPVSPVFVTHTKTAGVYTNNSHSGTRSLPSRDQEPLSVNTLESAFTNCDARNSFRMRIYKNCRVSLLFPSKNLKRYLKIRSRRCLFVPSLPLYFLTSLLRPSHATIPRPS
jgi:hypothetical protein